MLMNAKLILMTVTKMLTVPIKSDPIAAPVKMDLLVMVSYVKVIFLILI